MRLYATHNEWDNEDSAGTVGAKGYSVRQGVKPGKRICNTVFQVPAPPMTLESTQVAKFDQSLAIGPVAQEIEVTAEAPIVDSETATGGTHLTGQVLVSFAWGLGTWPTMKALTRNLVVWGAKGGGTV